MEWSDRVGALLWDGETIERRFDLEGGAVVVTSHRVLAFEPDSEGKNYRRVDRPNVEDVTLEGGGDWAPLRRAVQFGLGGAVLLGIAATVSFESFLGSVEPVEMDGGAGAGAGGVDAAAGAVDSVRRLLAMLDALVLVGGLLLSAAAIGFVGWYVRSRRRYLLIAVGGGTDVEVPVADPDPALLERLEAAIRLEPDRAGDASTADANSGGEQG